MVVPLLLLSCVQIEREKKCNAASIVSSTARCVLSFTREKETLSCVGER